MRRVTLLSLIMLTVVPIAAGAQTPQVIRFGIDPSYPPFESKAVDGSIVGFDFDIGNAICANLQAKCVWVEQSFDGLIPALKARKFDAILSAMTATAARRQQIDFTVKVAGGPSRLIARSGSTLRPDDESLRGKRVGVVQGSTQESFAKAVWAPKDVSVISYQTPDEIYQDLVTGRLDAAFQPVVQGEISFLKTPRGKGFAFAGDDVKDRRVMGDGAAIGVRKDDTQLVSKLNRAIENIRRDGTYNKIAAKYFDFDIYGD